MNVSSLPKDHLPFEAQSEACNPDWMARTWSRKRRCGPNAASTTFRGTPKNSSRPGCAGSWPTSLPPPDDTTGHNGVTSRSSGNYMRSFDWVVPDPRTRSLVNPGTSPSENSAPPRTRVILAEVLRATPTRLSRSRHAATIRRLIADRSRPAYGWHQRECAETLGPSCPGNPSFDGKYEL